MGNRAVVRHDGDRERVRRAEADRAPLRHRARGNFSPGVLIEGTLYISGQAGEDKNGKIPAGFEAEVQQALDNVGVVLQKAGMTAKNIDGMKIGDRIDIT